MVKVKFVDGSEVEYPTATHAATSGERISIVDPQSNEVAALFAPEVVDIQADDKVVVG